MSKNFELLQRAEQERAEQERAGLQTAVNTTGSQPGAAAAAPAIAMSAPALNGMDERSRQQMARLVQQLFLGPAAARAVVLASVEPGSGTSWVTAHCAQALAAQVSGSVCVVDANLRTPALHDYFSVTNHHGLSDAVQKYGPVRDFVHSLPSRPNLWLMSCGSVAADCQAVLASQALRTRIAELRAQFDYLLIDAPPLNLYGDALLLGQVADGMALVLAEQHTRKETARNTVEQLAKAHVRLLGAVLNKRTFPVPQKIYDRL